MIFFQNQCDSPAHMSVDGNEQADKFANGATRSHVDMNIKYSRDKVYKIMLKEKSRHNGKGRNYYSI